jgi:hypothetical protein
LYEAQRARVEKSVCIYVYTYVHTNIYIYISAEKGRQFHPFARGREGAPREECVYLCLHLCAYKHIHTHTREFLQRKVDNFIRLYEAERARLEKSVKDALTKILERTQAVQGLSKRMQEEGTELRKVAARVQVSVLFVVYVCVVYPWQSTITIRLSTYQCK